MRRHLRIALATATAALALCSSLGVAGGSATARAQNDDHKCSDNVDVDGFSDGLDNRLYKKRYVGNLSGLAVDSDGSIAAVSDRSLLFRLKVQSQDGNPSAEPIGVTDLRDEQGYPSLDSEAVVIDSDKTRLVTSEIEPSIRLYDESGRNPVKLDMPKRLLVKPAGRAPDRNLTLEGLTLQPGGQTLIASMEGPLEGDGKDTAGHTLVRLQSWHRGQGQAAKDFKIAAQYGYPIDKNPDNANKDLGISEIAATPDGRLLVLERGHSPQGNSARLYLADLSEATDVTDTENLPGSAHLVKKTLLADLVTCPDLGAPAKQPQHNKLLDNIEGMTVTGHTPDGKLNLLLVSDDNANVVQITRLYALTAKLPSSGS
ncbi:lipoprotein [Streptomyces bingchenggensis BCW-1]|uniref:Lipoprotein n=1 Tax=Streptomyces bingchenggensis (strain BCW-1) TaxID=749414 RepID=D7C1J9_STRBB|nr:MULTISPECIES: esterase-like activity of phytase family protein [Streptomyces]ADI10064.1 lipoprotein [Streptomyces bingchenggensis BCW-1]